MGFPLASRRESATMFWLRRNYGMWILATIGIGAVALWGMNIRHEMSVCRREHEERSRPYQHAENKICRDEKVRSGLNAKQLAEICGDAHIKMTSSTADDVAWQCGLHAANPFNFARNARYIHDMFGGVVMFNIFLWAVMYLTYSIIRPQQRGIFDYIVGKFHDVKYKTKHRNAGEVRDHMMGLPVAGEDWSDFDPHKLQ